MSPRRPSRLAAATGAALAGGLALAAPACAAVKYDPSEKTGFVDGGDVRAAFGWTDAVLASRASAVVFGHDFWTDDTYSVTCGGPAFPVVHHEQYGRFDLAATVTRGAATGDARARGAATGDVRTRGAATGDVRTRGAGTGDVRSRGAGTGDVRTRGAATGYHGPVLGFRLSGARSGISGTTVPPAVGQPCPENRGTTIDTVRRVSSATGWALTASYGATRRELLRDRTPATAPPAARRHGIPQHAGPR